MTVPNLLCSGLSAFTRLRALTLRQTARSADVLSGALLPASLEELTLDLVDLRNPPTQRGTVVPRLDGLGGLHNLRRIVLTRHRIRWCLNSWDDCRGAVGRLQLPAGLQVRIIALCPHAAQPEYLCMHEAAQLNAQSA